MGQKQMDRPVSQTLAPYVTQLKTEGWCMVEGVMPDHRIEELRDHVLEGHQKALQYYESIGGSLTFQTGPNNEVGTNAVAFVPKLAAYFGDERVVGIAKAMLDVHIRISQTEFKTRPAGDPKREHRAFHTDFPHDLTDREEAGAVMMPFPNATMSLTVLWILSPFSPANGGTWVVPKSHQDLRNPRSHLDPRNPPELHDDMPANAAISGEKQLTGPAGSAVILDSRIWHSAASNPSNEPRVTMLTRYAPWWLSLEFGGRNNAMVPKDVFDAFPDSVKDLYRHRAEGENDPIRKYKM